jgi:hypothetical protein
MMAFLAVAGTVLVSRPMPVLQADESPASCRFGVAATHTGGPLSQYDVHLLHIGWYWDFGARAVPELQGTDYVQTVRLSPLESGYRATPTGTALLEIIAANPGAWWLIGNEPDCIWQDDMRSDLYAVAYHDLYTLIKGADPTAKIGAGSIVQPTPQRLRYLDRVLQAYEQKFGEPLPADFWATHSYILCENCFPQRPGDPFPWGACPVPDWSEEPPDDAVYYSVYDHWRLDIFQERIVTFRRWMRDHGYRERPLFVSEYGILFYDGLIGEKTVQDNIAFMVGTFDWMRQARDPELGYPLDDNRLVQRWAWFSLDHDWWYLGGALFDYRTHQPLDMGRAYGAYTAALIPTADLRLAVWAPPVDAPPGSPVTATLSARLSNAGDRKTSGPVTLTFWSTDTGSPIGSLTLRALEGCGDGVEVRLLWAGLTDGAHPFCGEAQTAEESVATCGVVLVNPRRVYLPTIVKEAGK